MPHAAKFTQGVGFERAISFDKEPVKFKTSGKLDAPELVVEYDEDHDIHDGLHLDVSLGDLIDLPTVACSRSFLSISSSFTSSIIFGAFVCSDGDDRREVLSHRVHAAERVSGAIALLSEL